LGGLNAIEKKHPHEPHYYLMGLGVEPDLQGRGLGTKLMAPILERCDRDGIPAYLESSKEINVPLYERNGFKVTEQMTVPNGGPPIWLMWRDPQ
jgi:GNAT superfamily N-acetyltransferase